MRWPTIFLDAGGVLLHPDWRRVEAAFARRGIAAPAASLEAADPRARRALDVAETIERTSDEDRWLLYFNLLLEGAGVEQTSESGEVLESLRAEHSVKNLWSAVANDAIPFLRASRDRGVRLVVVSNSNGTLREHLKELGLLSLVDLVVDSAEERLEKPDPRIFEAALRRSGARPETTVHIGDLYNVDVVGARRAGIHPILLDPRGLYPEAECTRVKSLVPEAAEWLVADRKEQG